MMYGGAESERKAFAEFSAGDIGSLLSRPSDATPPLSDPAVRDNIRPTSSMLH